MKKQIIIPLCLWIFFEIIAVTLWQISHIFYLFNFTYIGTCVAAGMYLHMKKYKYARISIQFAVGLYMFIFLGLISKENMQIEGFWIFLFNGVFYAAVIHYAVAKLFGPFLFGRAWCGYACWTAMIFDLLPYKTAKNPRKKITFIRYIVFLASLLFGIILFLSRIPIMGNVMFWSFVIGNILYYGIGIALAFGLRDNRAFCKYICPITVFLKPASYFALIRIKIDTEKCISCGKCKKVCPMDVDMTDNSRKRHNGTECILCLNCIKECPRKALHN